MISGILPYQINGAHLRCEMKYDETKPYEITFVFRQRCLDGDCADIHELEWVIGRDLIATGVDTDIWIGEGDVSLRQDSHNTVQVILRTHEPSEHMATVTVPRRTLKDFLKLTYDLVGIGKESDQINWAEFDDERALWSS